MIAVDPLVRILFKALASKGPFSNRVLPVNSFLFLLAWKLSGRRPRQARRAIRQFFNRLSPCKVGVGSDSTNLLDA
jgi:hypothetical protein